MKFLQKAMIAALIVTTAPNAFAVPYFYAGPGASNVDSNPATVVDLTVTDFGLITDLTLALALSGSFIHDSSIYLIHNATEVQVWVGNPNSGNPNGSYDLTASFVGQQLNGLWQLKIHDVYVPGEGNSLNSWSISGNADS